MDRMASGRVTDLQAVSSIQDILCINCQEMVNLRRIAVHSLVCTQVSPEVRTIELQQNSLESVKFRIKKLSAYLKKQKIVLSKSPAESHFISVLFKLSERLLAEEAIPEIVKSLESMSETCKNTLSVLISVERLKGLAVEMSQKSLDQERSREIETLKAALQGGKAVSEIESKPESSRSGSSSIGESVPVEELADCVFPPLADISSVEAARKAFYSLCLSTKLSLRSRSQGLRVSMSALYDKARKECVPLERWAGFIEENLKHPDKSLMQSSRKYQKFAVAEIDTRFSYFSVAAITEAEAGTELD